MRFCCWVMCILCIFWILTPYRKYCLQRFFSPSIGGLFILLTVSFTVKSFLIWCSPIYLSLLFFAQEAAAAKSRQLCLTLCDPIDSSPPGSPIPGILQARPLEWVAISFSSAWKWKVKVKSLSCVRLFLTPWTAAYQASPSLGFSRQEYWSGLPLPSPLPKEIIY